MRKKILFLRVTRYSASIILPLFLTPFILSYISSFGIYDISWLLRIRKAAGLVIGILPAVIFFAGIQVLVYTVVMEFLGIRYIQKSEKPKTRLFIFTGTLVGAIAGFSVNQIFVGNAYVLIIYGILTGIIVTLLKLLLHKMERRYSLQYSQDNSDSF